MWKGAGIMFGVAVLTANLPVGEQVRPAPIEMIQTNTDSAVESSTEERLGTPCLPSNDNRTSDLCAQWKAADAARDSATWSEATFWISLLGSLVTAISVFFIWRSLEDSRQNAQKEYRAYLRFVPEKIIVQSHSKIRLYGSAINYGRTPARRYAELFGFRIQAPGWIWDGGPTDVPDGRPNFVMHPSEVGKKSILEGSRPLSEEEVGDLMSGAKVLYVRVHCYYEDVFGHERCTIWVGKATGDQLRNQQIWEHTDGNDAT